MNKRLHPLLLILVPVLLAAGIGLAVLQARERDALAERLKQSGTELERLKGELLALRGERDRLLAQAQTKKATGAPGIPAPTGDVPVQAPGAGKKAPSASPAAAMNQSGKAFAEMMKNPAMKEVMKQQQLVQLEMRYGSLFEHFGLDQAEKDGFKQLLQERLALQTELGFKVMDGEATKEQRDAWQKEYDDGKKASDAAIRSFLNNDQDFATFERWEDSEAERMRIETGRSQFATAGEPLTSGQEQQLLDAMYEARKAGARRGDEYGFSNQKVPDPSKFTEEDVNRQLSRLEEVDRSVYQAASGFLSAKQLETLRTQQQQWRAMTEMGLRMTATMFQTKKGS